MQRSPTHLAGEIFGAEPGRRLVLLKAAWPAAVGPELSRRSEVVALDGDLLRIRVADAIWRRSLWRMRRDLISRLRKIVGPAAPHALGFIEGLVSAPPEPRPPTTVPVRVARLPPALVDAADAIPDPEVRQWFRDAAARYLGRFDPEDQAGADEAEGGSD